MDSSIYIQDDELRELYAESSAECLQQIEAAITELLRNPCEVGAVTQEFLRTLHSFKGDSGSLGVPVEPIVSAMESVVAAMQSKQLVASEAVLAPLFDASDACSRLATKAIGGETAIIDSQVVIDPLEELLQGASPVARDPIPTAVPELPELPEPERQTAMRSAIDWIAADCRTPAELRAVARESCPEALASLAGEDGEQLVSALMGWILDADTQTRALQELQAAIARQESQSSESLAIVPAPPAREALASPEFPANPEPRSLSPTSGLAVATEPVTALSPDEKITIETVQVSAARLDWVAARSRALGIHRQRLTSGLDRLDHLLARLSALDLATLQQANGADLWHRLQTEIESLRAVTQGEGESFRATVADVNAGIDSMCRLPLATIFRRYPQAVRGMARQLGKQVELVTEGGEIRIDKRVIEAIKDILIHLIRNAIDHGIESPPERLAAGKPQKGTIYLQAIRQGNRLQFVVADDGRGLDTTAIAQKAITRGLYTEGELRTWPPERIQNLIFSPGFTTRTTVTEISGRGVGLDVVRSQVESLNGTIRVTSKPGQGCSFELDLGVALTTTDVLVVGVSSQKLAIPIDYVRTILEVETEAVITLQNQPSILFEGERVWIKKLSTFLGLEACENEGMMQCVVLQNGTTKLAVAVDRFHPYQKGIAVETNIGLLTRVPNILGATILSSGEVCVVLSPREIITAGNLMPDSTADDFQERAPIQASILLVEDSAVIRLQVKAILEEFGYEVVAVEDGRAGLTAFEAGNFTAIVSDIEMPVMSGLDMVRAIRAHPAGADLPIVLISTLFQASNPRLADLAGANAFLPKSNFNRDLLLTTLQRLIQAHVKHNPAST